jgi:tetratricopeptide (TPR) repeat protein
MAKTPTELRDEVAGATHQRIADDENRVSPDLKPILAALNERLFDSTLQIGALLKELGLHDNNIPTRFAKELDGLALWGYVTDCRLEVSAQLLEKSPLTPTQIAIVIGYAKVDTYRRAFKNWPGSGKLSPNEYQLNPPLIQPPPPPCAPLGDGDPIKAAERALASGAADGALLYLGDTAGVEFEARRALAYHYRGSMRALSGDVDNAYDDLQQARESYKAVDSLPRFVVQFRRHHLLEEVVTDELLTGALCTQCRRRLLFDDEMRQQLCRALDLVPRDLQWFRQACDPCYRVVWEAISRARFGLTQNAWWAWWISEYVDPTDVAAPPSRGRIIAALDMVERGTFRNQREHKRCCDLAVTDANALKDPFLKAEARLWRGSTWRGMGEYPAAAAEFKRAQKIVDRGPQWLTALRSRMIGLLAAETNDYPGALAHFEEATRQYETLDAHTVGVLLVLRGNVYFLSGRYEQSIAMNQAALSHLDSRLDPLPETAGIPIHLAISYGALGRWNRAEKALDQCCFDRGLHPGLAATERVIRACLMLRRGHYRESLRLFAGAKALFKKLNRPLDVALIAACCVEAHTHLKDYGQAIENADTALRFFQAAGCLQETLEAVSRLRRLLQRQVIDTARVVTTVRRLAKSHAGDFVWATMAESGPTSTSRPRKRRGFASGVSGRRGLLLGAPA